MTASAPLASLLIPELYQFIKNSALVAHNASFDSKFLHSELSKSGITANFDFICTLLLSRRLYPSLYNHKLETLVKYHGIKSQGKSHRALADALVTAELFIKISGDLKRHLSLSDITPHKFLASQRQPLSNFSKFTSQNNAPTKKLAPPNKAPSSPIKNQPSFPNPPKKNWIKTLAGLQNGTTGVVIPFADTLRDVLPIAGYRIKGHAIEFISDSEIANLSSQTTTLPPKSIANPIPSAVKEVKLTPNPIESVKEERVVSKLSKELTPPLPSPKKIEKPKISFNETFMIGAAATVLLVLAYGYLTKQSTPKPFNPVLETQRSSTPQQSYVQPPSTPTIQSDSLPTQRVTPTNVYTKNSQLTIVNTLCDKGTGLFGYDSCPYDKLRIYDGNQKNWINSREYFTSSYSCKFTPAHTTRRRHGGYSSYPDDWSCYRTDGKAWRAPMLP